jgi:uncharacterized beta-barrel protein YwiB (DUF1934 family)
MHQAGQRHHDTFVCQGYVKEEANLFLIAFENESLAGSVRIQENEAILIYTKPYPNTLTFRLAYVTQANYHSMYGVMALMIDTKKIEKLHDRVIFEYDLLQTTFKVGEYRVEIIFKGDTSQWVKPTSSLS